MRKWKKQPGKTKEVAAFIKRIAESEKQTENFLIVTDGFQDKIVRAGRNIAGVTIMPFNQLNTYEVLKAGKVLLMEEAVRKISQTTKGTKVAGSELKDKKQEKRKSKEKKVNAETGKTQKVRETKKTLKGRRTKGE